MNRELKFRAWDKNKKKMVYECGGKSDSGYAVTLEGDLLSYIDDWSECGHVWNEDPYDKDYVEIMQSTGLKDKNGKPIYEKDIVRFDILPEFTSTKEPIKNAVGEIRWDDSDTGYFILNNSDEWPHIKTFFATNIEVIGNSMETPDLLTG